MLLNAYDLEIINKSIPKAEGKITRKQAKEAAKKHYPDLPPNGRWVTIRGNHVYIADGKVVAGVLPWMSKKGEIKPKKATKAHLKAFQEHVDKKKAKEDSSASEAKPKKTSKKKATSEEKTKTAKKTTKKTTAKKKAEPKLVVEAPKKTATKKKTSEAKTVEEKIAKLYENDPAASDVARQSPRLAYLKQHYNSLLPKRLTKPYKKLKELIDNAKTTSELNNILNHLNHFSTINDKEDYKRAVAYYEDVLRSEQMKKKHGKLHNVLGAERDLKFIKDNPELVKLSPEIKEHFHPTKRKQVIKESLEYAKKFRQEAEEQKKPEAETAEKKPKKTAKKKKETTPASEEKPKRTRKKKVEEAAASEEPEKPTKVEKITATNAKKLMVRQVPVKYRDALLDTLQHEEHTFRHGWAKYDEGNVVNSKVSVTGKLYKKHEVEDVIQRYKNDPKFREEIHARVNDKEKAEKDAFESDVKEFMDELRKHYLNDIDVDFEVDRRLRDLDLKNPKKEEPKKTDDLDDLFGDDDDDFDTFDLGNLGESEERKKKREEIRRQVVKEAEDKLKDYEDMLRERLTQFYESKKKNHKTRYQRMSSDQIQHEMKKVAKDYGLPYGHRLLKRYMIAKQSGLKDWKM